MELKQTTLRHLDEVIARYPVLSAASESIRQAAAIICSCYRSGNKLLVCGNGGSAADSEHIVGELMKEFVLPRTLPDAHIEQLRQSGCEELAGSLQQGIPAIALTSHSSISTAVLNDTDPYIVFAQQVYVYGKPGDVLLGLSTSGCSKNVVNAIRVARAFGLSTIGLTGSKPCPMDELCTVTIKVPDTVTFKVQELHLPVYHTICGMVEEELFGHPG